VSQRLSLNAGRRLPRGLLRSVLGHLPLEDLADLRRTNKELKAAAESMEKWARGEAALSRANGFIRCNNCEAALCGLGDLCVQCGEDDTTCSFGRRDPRRDLEYGRQGALVSDPPHPHSLLPKQAIPCPIWAACHVPSRVCATHSAHTHEAELTQEVGFWGGFMPRSSKTLCCVKRAARFAFGCCSNLFI
jgi:hypothetical protein